MRNYYHAVKRDALETTFIADSMLGKLTKWLRIAGVDVEYKKDITDEELIRRANSEGRVILTRDRFVVKRKAAQDYLLIWGNYLREQLEEFFQVFRLDTLDSAFTRCIRCNLPLNAMERNEARYRVPIYVWETQEKFKSCPSCLRIYWSGTHREHAESFLKKVIDSF